MGARGGRTRWAHEVGAEVPQAHPAPDSLELSTPPRLEVPARLDVEEGGRVEGAVIGRELAQSHLEWHQPTEKVRLLLAPEHNIQFLSPVLALICRQHVQ